MVSPLIIGIQAILNISHNKLQDLPPKVFNRHCVIWRSWTWRTTSWSPWTWATTSWWCFRTMSFTVSRLFAAWGWKATRLRSLGTRPFYWLIRSWKSWTWSRTSWQICMKMFLSVKFTEVAYDSYASWVWVAVPWSGTCWSWTWVATGWQRCPMASSTASGNLLNAAAAEQSAGETSAKAISDSRRSSLGVFRTLEYVMQGDSLIFSVINHFSNRQNYCIVCNASLVLLRRLSVAQILHR